MRRFAFREARADFQQCVWYGTVKRFAFRRLVC